MFSPSPTSRTALTSMREAVRRAADLVVAFATLADLDEAAAYRTHDDADGSWDLSPTHPHRLPLSAPPRARRPGAVASRGQACTSPVGHRRPRHHRATAHR